jgi:hypothetical protein
MLAGRQDAALREHLLRFGDVRPLKRETPARGAGVAENKRCESGRSEETIARSEKSRTYKGHYVCDEKTPDMILMVDSPRTPPATVRLLAKHPRITTS